jgi:hypothetical protein
MAITVTTHILGKGFGFSKQGISADASGTETIVAAVAGKSHFIKSIMIYCLSAITVTIQDNTGTPIPILGGITFTTTAQPVVVTFSNPIKIASGKSIDVDASGAGQVVTLIQGYTE